MKRPHGWSLATAWVALSVLTGFFGLSGGIAAGSDGSSSSNGPANPQIAIRWSAFTQDGQELVWRVRLQQPFWADGLARERRSLCLLIERVATGNAWAELCVTGHGRHSTSPQLEYMKVTRRGAGPSHVVSATVTRISRSELTASFLPSAYGARYGPVRWQASSTSRAAACATVSSADACSDLYPARPTLVRFHVPVLVGCAASGPSLVFQGSSRRREIALTFDDGPWNDPPSIDFVNLLARYHVPATFFEIGDQIHEFDPNGSVQREMIADGDIIGDHTWTHPDMTRLSPGAQTSELELTVKAIKRASGFTTCLWRPPYEAFDSQVDSLARSLGLLTINYDVDTQDWTLPGTATIYQRAVDGAHNGAIILQHFGGGPRYETLAALPQEISTLRRRGYTFVTIPQLLGLRLIYR